MKSVTEKITEILTEKLGIAASEITPNANFIRDLGIDSLDYVELVMEFEQSFDIRIADTDSDQMKTVGQAIEYIEKKIVEKQAGI